MYAVDPSGDAIQLDADWGGDKPAWAALSEDDSLQNLCTQGNCSVANAPSPTSEACAAALRPSQGSQGLRRASPRRCVTISLVSMLGRRRRETRGLRQRFVQTAAGVCLRVLSVTRAGCLARLRGWRRCASGM